MDLLDRLFREKLGKRSFEFKDQYWRDAEAMIRKQEQQRRRAGWLWLLAGLVLISAIAGITLQFAKSGSPVIGALPIHTVPAGAIGNTTAEPPRLPQSDSKGVEKNQSSGRKSPLEIDPSQKSQATWPSADAGTIFGKADLKKDRPDSGSSLLSDDAERSDGSLKNRPIPDTFKPDNTSESDRQQSKEPSGSLQKVSSEEPSPNSDSLQSGKARAYMGPLEAIPSLIPADQHYLPDTALDLDPEIVKHNSWRFITYFSASVYPYFDASARKNVGYSGGLSIDYYIKGRWSAYAGLAYRLRMGNFSYPGERVRTTFGFGRQEERFLLLPKRLHYLEAPLGLTYDLGRHRFALGASLSRLLGLEGSLNRTEGTDFDPETASISILEKGWIAEDGFRQWLVSIQAAYDLQINRRWRIGLIWSYTPGSILDKDFEAPFELYLKESRSVLLDVRLGYAF